jgi:hypothetical protein
MSKNSKVLRSALISLAFAATIPAAWAGGQKFNVAMQDDNSPPRLIRVLDLKAPDIHDVMSADEIRRRRRRNGASPRCGPGTICSWWVCRALLGGHAPHPVVAHSRPGAIIYTSIFQAFSGSSSPEAAPARRQSPPAIQRRRPRQSRFAQIPGSRTTRGK